MAIPPTDLEYKLKAAFPDSKLIINDLVGDHDHYQIEIVSAKFHNLNRVKRHKLVHEALHDCLGTSLHALSIKKAITPEEEKMEK